MKVIKKLSLICFNPRTRVGCDKYRQPRLIFSKVSIHAPVWGATGELLIASYTHMFQSTHPCGVRLI